MKAEWQADVDGKAGDTQTPGFSLYVQPNANS